MFTSSDLLHPEVHRAAQIFCKYEPQRHDLGNNPASSWIWVVLLVAGCTRLMLLQRHYRVAVGVCMIHGCHHMIRQLAEFFRMRQGRRAELYRIRDQAGQLVVLGCRAHHLVLAVGEHAQSVRGYAWLLYNRIRFQSVFCYCCRTFFCLFPHPIHGSDYGGGDKQAAPLRVTARNRLIVFYPEVGAPSARASPRGERGKAAASMQNFLVFHFQRREPFTTDWRSARHDADNRRIYSSRIYGRAWWTPSDPRK